MCVAAIAYNRTRPIPCEIRMVWTGLSRQPYRTNGLRVLAFRGVGGGTDRFSLFLSRGGGVRDIPSACPGVVNEKPGVFGKRGLYYIGVVEWR